MLRFLFLGLGLALFLIGSASAAETDTLSGIPMVQDSGTLMLDGRKVTLWGVATLAGDQQCWRDDHAWSCGEQATSALKHYVEGQRVKCAIKSRTDDNHVTAQCTRTKNGSLHDIAHYLVAQGWARDDGDASQGFYAAEQEDARQHRRGIWTSRFQTAPDWHDGVQNYVEYAMEPKPVAKR